MDSKRRSIKKCDPTQTTAGKADEDQAIARAVLSPTVQAAFTLRECGRLYGRAELSGLVNALTEQIRASGDGDLKRAEAMLTAQAHTMDGIFNLLARLALNSEDLGTLDRYLKLGLRAQSQCRMTWEALSSIKNPRMVGYVQQANIAHGPQQINIHKPEGKLEENQIPPNELLENKEHEPDEWLATRAPPEAIGADSKVESVGEVHRTENA